MINREIMALVLATTLLLLPLLTAPFDRRFLGSNPGTARKLGYYALTIATLWGLTAVAVRIFPIVRLNRAFWPWWVWLPSSSVSGPVIGILLAAFFGLALMPLLQSLRGTRWRRAYARAYRRHTEGFSAFLPETAAERFAFVLVSLTAGFCEEVLYRGFLIRYLHESVPAPLLTALIASSLVFGLAHIYQGVSAVLRIGLTGVAFGLLFLLSGSLVPGIVLHAFMDLQGVYVLRPFHDEDAAAAEA